MRAGIEDVAGVADGGLADAPRCRRARASIASCMLSVELSESKMRKTSMPCSRAALDERAHDVVGIGRVADGVAGAQQHLEQDVGHALRAARARRSHGSSWRKRIDVSNVAPPHISRLKSPGSRPRHRVGDRQHVVGAHARRQQRLVRVAQRRVGEQQPLLAADPLGELLRAELAAASAACPAAAARRASRRPAAPARSAGARRRRLPFTSGRPLTMTSPRYDEQSWWRGRAARGSWNSSGVSSMKRGRRLAAT